MLYRHTKEINTVKTTDIVIFSETIIYTGNTFPPIFVILRRSTFIKVKNSITINVLNN